jgi:molybdopterin-synthase adenylyltransferase
VIREITGFGEGIVSRLLLIDALTMRFETICYRFDPDSPLHGTAAAGSMHSRIAQYAAARVTSKTGA